MLASLKKRVGLAALAAFVVTGLALSGLQPSSAAQQEGTEGLPPGARIETLLSDMNLPIAMVFDPQGRLFYTEKVSGNVRLFENGMLRTAPVIHFDVESGGEQGLLGITIDPNFPVNRYLYVYYTCDCTPRENRVVRFVENNGVGSNPTTIFTSPNTTAASNHNGGNIHFDPSGKLYISLGDDGNTPQTSQDVTVKQGKIHRINSDGTIPADNPVFTQTSALPSIYAIGLRNSFDFTFDPVTPVSGPFYRMFASENGPACDDEMNRIEAGFNYGWRPAYPCDDQNPSPTYNTIRPLWYLGAGGSGNCCLAPTGIEVYTGTQIPQWRNHLFMAAYTGGTLRHFYLNNERTAATTTNVVRGVNVGMDIETGPDGALWYIEGGGYSAGVLKRIVGPGASAQTATVSPGGTPGAVPTVSIPGSNSRLFPETGKTVRGLFLDYWEKNGGLAQQGFPISEVLGELSDLNGKPYTVQYFERAVFEYHPENQPPFNVLLSQLGTFQYRKKYPNGAPNQRVNNEAGSVLFSQTGKRVGGRFLDYWQRNGGLAQQGYPISDEFTEVSDLNGQAYTVQYFERAVFEYHPENQPPFNVLLSQLGTFRLREKGAGRVAATIPLASAPLTLAAGEGYLWAALENGTVVSVDLTTNKMTGNPIALGFAAPHDMTVGAGSVWVTGETRGEGVGGELRLARIDARSRRMVADLELAFDTNYNSVAVTEDAAWIATADPNAIVRIEP